MIGTGIKSNTQLGILNTMKFEIARVVISSCYTSLESYSYLEMLRCLKVIDDYLFWGGQVDET